MIHQTTLSPYHQSLSQTLHNRYRSRHVSPNQRAAPSVVAHIDDARACVCVCGGGVNFFTRPFCEEPTASNQSSHAARESHWPDSTPV